MARGLLTHPPTWRQQPRVSRKHPNNRLKHWQTYGAAPLGRPKKAKPAKYSGWRIEQLPKSKREYLRLTNGQLLRTDKS